MCRTEALFESDPEAISSACTLPNLFSDYRQLPKLAERRRDQCTDDANISSRQVSLKLKIQDNLALEHQLEIEAAGQPDMEPLQRPLSLRYAFQKPVVCAWAYHGL